MPFAFAGLVLSLSHHGSAPGQGPITNNAPSVITNSTNDETNKSGGTNILNITGPQRLLFDATIGDQLASKLPNGKSIEIMAKGFDVSFTRTSETVPPPDRKITLHNDPATLPIIVIIAPSAL